MDEKRLLALITIRDETIPLVETLRNYRPDTYDVDDCFDTFSAVTKYPTWLRALITKYMNLMKFDGGITWVIAEMNGNDHDFNIDKMFDMVVDFHVRWRNARETIDMIPDVIQRFDGLIAYINDILRKNVQSTKDVVRSKDIRWAEDGT